MDRKKIKGIALCNTNFKWVRKSSSVAAASKTYCIPLKRNVLVVVPVARVVGEMFSRASGMISAKEIQIMQPAAKPAKKGKRAEKNCTKM